MRLSTLVRRNARRNLGASMLIAIGMSTGIAALLFFVSLGAGVRVHVLERVFAADQLEVVPPRADFGMLQTRGTLFGGTGLSDATIEQLEAMPAVSGVYPKVQLGFPSYASGGEDIVGRTFWTELIADGLPGDLIGASLESDDPTLAFEDWGAPRRCAQGCAPGSDCIDDVCVPRACDPLDELWAGPDRGALERAVPIAARAVGARTSAFDVRDAGADASTATRYRLAGRGVDARRVARALRDAGTAGGRYDADRPCTEAPSYCHEASRTCRMPVPVVVSPTLLELYNGNVQSALAGSDSAMRNLPRMSESALIGLGFDATLGRGYLGESRSVAEGAAEPERVRLRLVGFSALAIPVGVTMPLGYVERWNERYGERTRRDGYDSLIVVVGEPGALHDVAHTVESELGLALDDRYEQARRASLLVAAMTAVLALVSLLIVVLAAGAVLQAFLLAVIERRAEIGTLRALGATRGDVLRIVLAEAALVGVTGVVLGLGAAAMAMSGVDHLLFTRVPDFPFKPSTLFHIEPGRWAIIVATGVGLSVLAAAWPAWRATTIDPAEAMGD